MFIKLHDEEKTEIAINTVNIKYMRTDESDGITTIGFNDGTSSYVVESINQILEITRAERAKQ